MGSSIRGRAFRKLGEAEQLSLLKSHHREFVFDQGNGTKCIVGMENTRAL